jgi:hypothetical protein
MIYIAGIAATGNALWRNFFLAKHKNNAQILIDIKEESLLHLQCKLKSSSHSSIINPHQNYHMAK